jgi:hypothetical protein
MINSGQVNKTLRRYIGPLLRGAGFQRVEARRAWRWGEASISHVVVRSVGGYFSQVTGWPSQSLVAEIGVYFPTIPPDGSRLPKVDKAGRLTPAEFQCHLRGNLYASIDQTQDKAVLGNLAERRRTDIWWVRPNGSNVIEVVEDITTALLEQGIPWLDSASQPRIALAEVEAGHDCLVKFWNAKHLAALLGLQDLAMNYARKYEAEVARMNDQGHR